MKRNQSKIKEYLKKYGYECMSPSCTFGYDIEVHHIVPLSKGGIDEEENYITLCFNCHRKFKLHKRSKEVEIELATYKHYAESLRDYEKVQRSISVKKAALEEKIHEAKKRREIISLEDIAFVIDCRRKLKGGRT